MADHDSQQELEDELTAYLDGELDAESVRRVEERLARDESYRTQLQKLDRTWSLLDGLPRASVDEKFTKTTLEMVALSASHDADAVVRGLPARRRRQRLAGVISMAAALLVGFAIGSQVWPDPNQKLLADLPVLENLDLYYQVDDVEFLRLLDREHVFEDSDSDSPTPVDIAPQQAAGSQSEELAARQTRIAGLDAGKQQDLLRKFERFEALSAAEQQRLRDLQAQITADPHSQQLLLVLERYHEWLKTITTPQRAKLAELPAKERVDQIEAIQRERRDAQRLEPLNRQDMREIGRWIDELVERHRKELVAGIPQRYREWYNRQTDADAKRMALVFRLFGRSRGDEQDSKVTEQDVQRLTEKLSDSARAELAKADSPEAQRSVVRGWVFASLRRSSSWQRERRGNPVVGDELLQFLQTEVPPAERERLLKKPREEMLQELRKMYFERSGGPRRSFDGRGDGHRPDGERRDQFRRGPRPRPPAGEPPGPQPEPRGDKPAESPKPADAPAPAAEKPSDSPQPTVDSI
jgi:hypothetical protein